MKALQLPDGEILRDSPPTKRQKENRDVRLTRVHARATKILDRYFAEKFTLIVVIDVKSF